jgi:hypothetical protein
MKEEKKDCWPWGYILDIKFDEPYYLQSAGGITQTLRLDNRFVYFQYTDFYYNQQPCSSLHERNSLSIHMEAVRLAGKPTKKTYGRYRIWASPIIRPSRCVLIAVRPSLPIQHKLVTYIKRMPLRLYSSWYLIASVGDFSYSAQMRTSAFNHFKFHRTRSLPVRKCLS